MKDPIYFRKPKHKESVIATDRGWEVERTGELLVRVRDLKQKLSESGLLDNDVEKDVIDELIDVIEHSEDALINDDASPEKESVKEDEPKTVVKKKRGRPAKKS